MNGSIRRKKVASLIKTELSRLLFGYFQSQEQGLVSITKVDMTKDCRTAHVYLSVFQNPNPENLLAELEKRKGYFRKSIASKTKLKYNPLLIFSMDPSLLSEEKIQKILNRNKNAKD